MVTPTNGTHNGEKDFTSWMQEYETKRQPTWHQAHPAFTDTMSWVDNDTVHHSVCVRTDSLEDLVSKVRTIKELIVKAKQAPVSPPAVTPEPTDPASICQLHGVPMKQHQNARGKWFAHRTAEGEFCHGKKKGGA
jgi:hypothetical protein